MPGFIPDEIQRYIIPDLYPRRDDPFRPAGGLIPTDAPAGAQGVPGPAGDFAQQADLTVPGARPVVFQQALNFNVTLAANVAQPLTNGSFQCDTIIIDVFSTAANSVFFGFGSSVNALNGIEVRAGLPLSISPENTREQWELQRALEALCWNAGLTMETYRAPRVVFDSSKYFLFATAATSVSVMIFTIPEFQ